MSSADIEQGSEAWVQARLGRVTASRIADVVARTKIGWGSSRANYAAQLIAERLTGEQVATYSNASMAWGVEHEAEARFAYEFRTDAEVIEVGFIEHPNIAMTGASPDGFVGPNGLVEIKAPNTATHIETLLGQVVPSKYILQMQWQMACSGRQWCDFVSYDPRMPESMRLFVKRVVRDNSKIAEVSIEIQQFLVEVDETVRRLNALYGTKAAA